MRRLLFSLRHVGVLALLVVASGCAWNRTVINEETFLDRAALVEPGVTRAEELPELLGSTPLTWLETGDGRQVFVYVYGETKTEAFNIVLLGISKTNSMIDSAYFVVGPDGKVVQKFVGDYSREVPWEWWAFGG